MASLLSGDRRWGQTRKSGMTVLGKVPKPINLPSQKLENQGVDPNVEIVPKGTLTWGSRQGLATPNAWGSSSVSSPNTDGDGSSPSYLSGSLTRPSTATSDKSHQTISAAWGPNSRPSSASGALPSDQVPAAATRPRSAGTGHTGAQQFFPGEPSPDAAAWGPSRNPERLAFPSKPNAFNLNTGDFPTLGAEKIRKSSLLAESDSSYTRPASASGRVNVEKESVGFSSPEREAQTKGTVNTWKAEAVPNESWRRDQLHAPPTHQNMIMMPQYPLDWSGPHMVNAPEGMWFRGPPPGGIFRPAGPGTYPIDPYLFYPQIPARPIAYSPMNGPPYPPQPAVFDGPTGLYGPRIKPEPFVDFQSEPFVATVPSKIEKEAEDEQRPRFRVLLKHHDRWKDTVPAAAAVVSEDNVKSEPSVESEDSKQLPSIKKSSSLIEKIQGLNSKARAVDGSSSKQSQGTEGSIKNIDDTGSDTTEVMGKSSVEPEVAQSNVSSSLAPGSPVRSHRKHHGHQKSRLSDKKDEEGKSKSQGSMSAMPIVENLNDSQAFLQDVNEKRNLEGKIDEKSHPSSSTDSDDLHAQHARMKEMARQRAQQLQREEEERTREQKARALAKLAELDRRASVPNNSNEGVSSQPRVNLPETTKPEEAVKQKPVPVQKRRHHKSPEEKQDDAPAGGVLVGSIIISTDFGSTDKQPQKKKTGKNRKEKSAAAEDGFSKCTASWKPQQPRKTSKNTSIVGPEGAVVWAPVKPTESKKEELPISAEDPTEQAQSKSKRAEMERYVPKPAAGREAPQQKVHLNKNNGKAHTSWRPRGEPPAAEADSTSGAVDSQFQASELGEKRSRARRPSFRAHVRSEDAGEEAHGKRSLWQLKSTTVNVPDLESTRVQHGPHRPRYRERSHNSPPHPTDGS